MVVKLSCRTPQPSTEALSSPYLLCRFSWDCFGGRGSLCPYDFPHKQIPLQLPLNLVALDWPMFVTGENLLTYIRYLQDGSWCDHEPGEEALLITCITKSLLGATICSAHEQVKRHHQAAAPCPRSTCTLYLQFIYI